MNETGSEGERGVLLDRLRARRSEIEQAALTRVYAIADPIEAADPAYAEGLRAAVSTALDYGFATIAAGEDRAPAPPATLLVQARIAARSGVSLDTVLRRYLAGYALLQDFLIAAAEDSPLLSSRNLRSLLRSQAALFDRLLAAVSEEYGRETTRSPGTSEQRRAERVRRLLEGEPVDTSELAYDLDGFHLGVVASGPDAVGLVRRLAGPLDRRLMLVRPDRQAVWAWFGGRRRLDPAELVTAIPPNLRDRVAIALGEPGEDLTGWRLTHQQARAASPIAERRGVVRYGEVALLASILRDELLTRSLHQLYLAPLEGERDGGEAARETLRAYFRVGRNVSSAAAALGVNRNTVGLRLRAIEERIGRRLDSCAPDVEVALRLAEVQPVTPRAVR